MYKRRTKSGNLGIVRSTTNVTANTKNDKSENVEPKRVEVSLPENISRQSIPQGDDDDEVISDNETEPVPKRSRRFTSNSSSVMRELSNTAVNQTSPRISSMSKTSNSITIHSLKKDSKILSDKDGSKGPFLQPTQSRNYKITSVENVEILKEVVFEARSSNSRSLSNSQRTKENLIASSQRISTIPVGKESQSSAMKKTNFGNFNKIIYLEELFESAGLVISHGSTPNILKVDQAIFVRDVTKDLSLDEKERKRNVENLIKDLENYCNDITCFKYSVTSTETDSECEAARGAAQDSLMRLLLHIDCLQAPVTELLMDKMAKFVMDGVSEHDCTPVLTWVRMILQCYRFLDRMLVGSTVNDRLLDVLQATSDTSVQHEIVLALPDIIGDAEHHHTAIELSKLVRKSGAALRACALEALTNLSLQPEVRAEVQPLLLKAVKKVQPEFLPTMLKFLFTDCDTALMDEMITYLRAELDLTDEGSGSEGDLASAQVLVFSTLRDSLLASRTLPNVWLKNISAVKTREEHRPMDIIMLLVFFSTSNEPARHKEIEAVFRNKIRAELFTETLINDTIKDYIAVIKEYFHVTTKLAGVLLKSSEPAIVEFASKIYIGVFAHTSGLWCQWLVTELQVCVGAGDSCVARAALNVLQQLTDQHHAKIKPLGVVLMLLLNKLGDLAPSEVCQLMDVLCHVAYSDEGGGSDSDSVLQDEISILVQKQLASSQISKLRSGVIGCVMSIKHIATVPKDCTEPTGEEPTEKAKKASHLLELLLSSTQGCVEAHGLALDQLSQLLIAGKMILDASFIKILSGLMRDKLQDAFLVDSPDYSPKDDVLKSKLQFCLDDDTDGAIVLNICELTSEEANATQPNKPSVAVSWLHPLLRLLRGLEMADLSEIDALLGCAIALPAPVAYAEFSQLTAFQQHVALNCLFHCANWFYEIVNTFAYLVKQNDADKVVLRLRAIVYIRGLLTRCLPLAMEYTPPICHFHALPKPKTSGAGEKSSKKGRKKKGTKKSKKKASSEESVLTGKDTNSQEDEEEEEEESVEEKMADLSKYKYYFRELDIDVWLILTLDLTLTPRPEKNGEFSAELGPSELLFLLEDYVAKISRALTASTKRVSHLKTANQNLGFENLDNFSAKHLAKNTIKLLPDFCGFLEKTVEYTQNLVKVNDGILDSTGMFIEGSAEIKKCQAKLLRIIAILFSWVGFQNPVNDNYLLVALQKIASRAGGDGMSRKNKRVLVRECVTYLCQCRESVLDLSAAGALVDAVAAVARHASDDPAHDANIAALCQELLGRRWYDMRGEREKGAALNGHATELLSRHLRLSRDRMAAVTAAASCLAEEHAELSAEKDATLATYPVFSKSNVHLLVAGLLKGLEGAVRQKLEGDELRDADQLDIWAKFTECLETLVGVLKANDSKPNLRAFMKGCTAVLKLFLSHGMSTCTFMFRHQPALVSQILKKLQVTTRYIQTICNYVKVSKDTGLTQFLPPIRAVMETILLRVKNIIVLNNCADAFFMGSMKNRDLKGQEIPSQDVNSEDEDVDIPKDSDSENECKNENEDDEKGSDSEERDDEMNGSASL